MYIVCMYIFQTEVLVLYSFLMSSCSTAQGTLCHTHTQTKPRTTKTVLYFRKMLSSFQSVESWVIFSWICKSLRVRTVSGADVEITSQWGIFTVFRRGTTSAQLAEVAHSHMNAHMHFFCHAQYLSTIWLANNHLLSRHKHLEMHHLAACAAHSLLPFLSGNMTAPFLINMWTWVHFSYCLKSQCWSNVWSELKLSLWLVQFCFFCNLLL